MPYYMGDFYTGDPGFFSFLSRVGRGVAGLGKGLLGIPTTGAGRAVSMALPAAAGVAATGIVRRSVGLVKGGAASAGRIISKHPVISAAAAAGAIGAGTGAVAEKLLRHRARGGGRRMRVTNPRALRRALRRAHGFAKLAMRTIHLVYPRKKCHFGGFKRARKARV